jgi:starch-binding outer membrane protein, SusD/RagB family
MINKILLLIIPAVIVIGCKKNLSPLDDNHQTLEDIYNNPAYAEGILLNAYTRLPTNTYSFNDVATDDAVTNNRIDPLLNLATGAWSSAYNPVEQWTNAYTAINYINLFLREVDSVNWSYLSSNRKLMFKDRLKGESYGLRALFYYYLLQAHAGYSNSGELLGVPILTEALELNSNFSKPRNSFAECVQQIYRDITEAEKYLPLDYGDVGANQVPAKYAGIPNTDYNLVFGNVDRQRMSARIAKAIRARVALLAASPAFNAQGDVSKWTDAATYAGNILMLNNGVAGLDPQGAVFYTGTNVNAININPAQGSPIIDQKEMLWRGNISTSNTLEVNNFPPSLYGNGRVNPTQNLVDAFPMANGYPITNAASGYTATSPYTGRDPRLRNYILYNGGTMSGATIYTRSDPPANGSINVDAVNALVTSTRTGYYMRKLLREDVSANPSSSSVQKHYPVHIRYTEMYLDYAEAANEAYGPDGMGSFNFSARSVIAAIRRRSGIAQADNYLASITTKDDMRQLIRNERRLELCFEGFRFWDLRRWKVNLNEQAKGVTILNNVYTIQPVENRQFSDNAYYGPIPILEAVKANLQQNRGW